MKIDVEYILPQGTATISGELDKEDVENAVKYGLYFMLLNGVIPVKQEQPPILVEGNDTVN